MATARITYNGKSPKQMLADLKRVEATIMTQVGNEVKHVIRKHERV